MSQGKLLNYKMWTLNNVTGEILQLI